MIEPGQPFPRFTLEDQDGNTVTSDGLRGAPVIYYFYPKDDTSGCTQEACEFRDGLPKFTGAKVFGVSPDPVKSHKKFADKYGLTFPLLADPEKTLLAAVGVWVEKSMYGRKYMGVERTTVLVDADGIVKKVWNKVKVPGHAAEVLASL